MQIPPNFVEAFVFALLDMGTGSSSWALLVKWTESLSLRVITDGSIADDKVLLESGLALPFYVSFVICAVDFVYLRCFLSVSLLQQYSSISMAHKNG